MSLFANHAGKTDPLLGLIEKSSAVSHTRLHACITFRSGAIAAAEDRAQQATGTRPDYLAQLRERFPEAKINGNIVELTGESALSFHQLIQPDTTIWRQR